MRPLIRSWPIVGFAALTVAIGGSSWQLRTANRELERARRDAAEATKLAREIIRLRRLPEFAALEAESVETILDHVERAAEQSTLAADSLARIQPLGPVTWGNSAYRLRPVRLELRGVSMEDAVKFTHFLTVPKRGLVVRDIEFWPDASPEKAHDNVVSEQWNAELTLTQLVFSPIRR